MLRCVRRLGSLVARATSVPENIAIAHPFEGRSFSYASLLQHSARLSQTLLAGGFDLAERRVAFLAPPSYDYAVMLLAIWRAGGVAVPLCVSHPRNELLYSVKDSGASLVVAHPQFTTAAADLGTAFLEAHPSTWGASDAQPALPPVDAARRALIIYTSGTTGPPKGVVTTHAMLEAQVSNLLRAWAWQPSDRIFNVLPLHHVHGVVNVLASALAAGACCEMSPTFDARRTWDRIASGETTLFMAVPTVYAKLIAQYEQEPPARQAQLSAAAAKLRLMVSGSAALPDPVMRRWQQISGHVLLERYGMTEIGMALTNPLHGQRNPGFVGLPFPGVEVKIVAENGEFLNPHTAAQAEARTLSVTGELLVRGPNVFSEYFGKPEATAKEFDAEGFFRTGDVAEYSPPLQSYKLLGRASADIIKSGGYKISALDIERVLLAHPAVAECAVVGVADPTYGQRIGAIVVVKAGAPALSLEDLRVFARADLAGYQLPTLLKVVGEIPRNAMGKVNKKTLVSVFNS